MSESAAERPIVDAEPARPVAEEKPRAKKTPSSADRARRSGYRVRFMGIYLALAVVSGLGIGAFIMLVSRPDVAPARAWSSFVPTGSEIAKARQIADHVSKQYRVDGNQLAVAIVGPPQVTSADGAAIQVPITAIAVLPDTSTGQQEEDDVAIVDTSSNLQVVLCGLGESCSIPFGEPSEARHTLLRREALELALYTFRYVDGIDSITVLLPPALPESAEQELTSTAVYLERGDISPELGRPLVETLRPIPPPVGEMSATEQATVNRITIPRLYQYAYRQAQDGSAIMLLSPLAA